jgi:hypothetical protein
MIYVHELCLVYRILALCRYSFVLAWTPALLTKWTTKNHNYKYDNVMFRLNAICTKHFHKISNLLIVQVKKRIIRQERTSVYTTFVLRLNTVMNFHSLMWWSKHKYVHLILYTDAFHEQFLINNYHKKRQIHQSRSFRFWQSSNNVSLLN